MTTFDDREKGFETKFALDQEQEFKAVARRNKLLGLWAADKMGLNAESADQYASAVVRADFEQPGEEDVFRKVAGDFKGAGLTVSESEIRSKMDELASMARDQVRAVAQRVEVVSRKEVRIRGLRSELLRTLTAASGVEAAVLGVRAFEPKWRALQDSNLRPPA